MKVSLVITGGSRLQEVRRFFASLMAQSYDLARIQVIFVNQREDRMPLLPSGLSGVEIFSGKLPLSEARNLGLGHADGDVVGFPDDDCWYGPRVVDRVVEIFQWEPELGAICFNVLDPDRDLTYGGRPRGAPRGLGWSDLFRLPISVGIFVRSSVGGALRFNPALGAGTKIGSGEETEYVGRLLHRGIRISYFGDEFVFHPVAPYVADDVEKYHGYGVGFGYVNGVFLREGNVLLLPYLLSVILRSFIGSIVCGVDPLRRRLYWRRGVGVLVGLALALGWGGR